MDDITGLELDWGGRGQSYRPEWRWRDECTSKVALACNMCVLSTGAAATRVERRVHATANAGLPYPAVKLGELHQSAMHSVCQVRVIFGV